jgi:HEAT repeat protein
VRRAAAGALGEIGDPRAVEALEDQLDVPDWALRASVIKALARLGASGHEALERSSISEDEDVRALAEVALA